MTNSFVDLVECLSSHKWGISTDRRQ